MSVLGSVRRLACLVALGLGLLGVGADAPARAAEPVGAAAAQGQGRQANRFRLGTCDGRTVPLAYDERGSRHVTRCGRLIVPLDRRGDVPGTVALSVRALVPRRGRPTGTPVVHLSGGPGEAATRSLDRAAEGLGSALGRRMVVTFDQRGTGDSGALICPSLSRSGDGEAALDAAIAACARRLGPRRAFYGTAASVADLEALRIALRAPRLVLWGTSYGTRLALDYAARHPRGVARLVLDSVVPPAGVDPFMRSTFAAIPRVLDGLCAPALCPFTTDPAADLAALVQKMRAEGPLRGRWIDHKGRVRTIALDPERLLDRLVDGDLDPFARLGFPAAVRSAVAGDLAPLARLAAPARFEPRGSANDGDEAALFVATRCADGPQPWPAGTPVAQRNAAADAALAALPPAALAPFDAATVREDGSHGLCRAWPEAATAPPAAGVLPDVPALLLSGDADLRTPREDAAAVAAKMPRARLLTVPLIGHSVLSWATEESCISRGLRRFLRGAPVRDCPPPTNLTDLTPTQLAPASFDALTPAGAGLPPKVGRTVAALRATFDDLQERSLYTVIQFMDSDWDIDDPRQPEIGWGGLRGGRATYDTRVTARAYEVVPGVRVSGVGREVDEESIDLRYTLRVSGPAAAQGTVRVDRGRIVGRLDGVAVDVRAP